MAIQNKFKHQTSGTRDEDFIPFKTEDGCVINTAGALKRYSKAKGVEPISQKEYHQEAIRVQKDQQAQSMRDFGEKFASVARRKYEENMYNKKYR